jgi:PknH-like extracellular domain
MSDPYEQHPPPWQQGHPPQPAYPPPPPGEPTFQVRVTKHTGAIVFWFNQRMTVTGTYAQCDAALTAAQQHNMAAGWWSIGSLLWNPISLSSNNSARQALRLQAQQAHDYAAWWAAQRSRGGTGQPPVWTPPPAAAPTRRRWPWVVAAVIAVPVVLVIALVILVALFGHHHESATDQPLGPVAALELTAPEAATALHLPSMSQVAVPDLADMSASTASIVDDDCVALTTVAAASLYSAPYLTIEWQSLRGPADNGPATTLDEAIINTPTNAQATSLYDTAVHAFGNCAGRTINTLPANDTNGPADLWSVGPVGNTDGLLTVSLTENGTGAICQRALTLRGNTVGSYVADVRVCAPSLPGSAATDVIAAIDNKIDVALRGGH